MKDLFHLTNHINFKRDKAKLINRVGLKNFCRVLDDDSNALFELNSMMLIDIFDVWVKARVRDPS